MSRRKQANPAKLDPQDDEPQHVQHLRFVEDSCASGDPGCDEIDQEVLDLDQKANHTALNNQDPDKSDSHKCTVRRCNHLPMSPFGQLQFTCAYCPRLFKHKRSRDRHTKLHTGDKNYKCHQCDSAFSRSDHLKIHMKTHDSRKPYKCDTCNRGYNTIAALSSHQQNHLKQENISGNGTSEESVPSPIRLHCSYCSEGFEQLEVLQNHMAMVHSDADSSLSRTPEPLYQNQTEDCKVFCMYCTEEFVNLNLLYQHLNSAHSDVHKDDHSTTITNSPLLQSSSPKLEICQNKASCACDKCTTHSDTSDNFKKLSNAHCRSVSVVHNYSSCQIQPTDLSKKKKKEDLIDKINKKKKKEHHHAPTITSPYDTDDKPCICSCCYAQLPNFKSFLHHMESHVISSNSSLLGFCPVCGIPERDPVAFTNHIFSHAIAHVPGRCCYTCKKTFERLDELQKHLLDVHVVSVFKCSICNDIFDTKVSMELHLSNKHSDECNHFKCYLCTNQIFHDRLSAEVHISMKHYQQFTPCLSGNQTFLRSQYSSDIDNRSKEYHLYQCAFCQKSFKDQYSQYMHIIKEHNGTKESKFLLEYTSKSPNAGFRRDATSNQMEVDSVGSDSMFTCDICNRNDFRTELELINHKKNHIGKSKAGVVSLQCAYCNEYCKSRHDLENHMKTHQVICGKGKHKCNICDAIYSSTLTLADHKLTHCKIVEGNCCVQCKSVLNDEHSFYNHQLQHTNCSSKPNSQINLPANCIICCQTLQTDVEIKLHARFHLKHLLQRECLCGICNKIFGNTSGRLNDSENVSIFVCNDCNLKNETKTDASTTRKLFSPKLIENDSVNINHTSVHLLETNFECRLCKQIFPSSVTLQTHLIEHNFYGMNQYSCYVCSSVFTAAAGLQHHIIGHGLENRPYECSECQMKFFFRAELDNHGFIHKNQTESAETTCKYCSNTFVDKPFFLDHIKQCPFKVSPKKEHFEVANEGDNKIKQEVVDYEEEVEKKEQ